MRPRCSVVSVVVLGCAVGCHELDGHAVDAGVACAPERTVQCVIGPARVWPQACTGEPIEAGAFCDDLFACVPDEAAAQALVAVAPGFACAPGPGELAVCDAGEQACQWRAPDTIDGAELEAICAVTVLPAPPAQVMCTVYVKSRAHAARE